jgi:AraC-like DNA-binding protein
VLELQFAGPTNSSIKMQDAAFPPIAGPIIQRVTLVDRITRPELIRFRSNSLPGHLLHLVIEGRVRQTSGGRKQHLVPGDVVWYYEDESIRGEILQVPWTFYTVNFEAPTLAPPPEHKRLQHVKLATATKFEALYDAWHNPRQSDMARHLRVHVLLLGLLLDLLPIAHTEHRLDAPTQPWWEIEAKLRGKLDQPIDLPFLQSLSSLSQRRIVEACKLATKTTPMKRVKDLRLSYARGLVQHSDLSISEIAYRTGYSRVQELSRDYHERFQVTPRGERAKTPTYRHIVHTDEVA